MSKTSEWAKANRELLEVAVDLGSWPPRVRNLVELALDAAIAEGQRREREQRRSEPYQVRVGRVLDAVRAMWLEDIAHAIHGGALAGSPPHVEGGPEVEPTSEPGANGPPETICLRFPFGYDDTVVERSILPPNPRTARVGYTRDDVAERRVAEAVARAPEGRAYVDDLRNLLNLTQGELLSDAIRRVVAERDAALKDAESAHEHAVAAIRDVGLAKERADRAEAERDATALARDSWRKRAETAEARVRELEAINDEALSTADETGRKLLARAESAERELASVTNSRAAIVQHRDSIQRELAEVKAKLASLQEWAQSIPAIVRMP